jgi:hypothetical protein
MRIWLGGQGLEQERQLLLLSAVEAVEGGQAIDRFS